MFLVYFFTKSIHFFTKWGVEAVVEVTILTSPFNIHRVKASVPRFSSWDVKEARQRIIQIELFRFFVKISLWR